jgi:hypothetical protein
MTWWMIFASILSGWAILSVLGTERQRRVSELERQLTRQAQLQALIEAQRAGEPASVSDSSSAGAGGKSVR